MGSRLEFRDMVRFVSEKRIRPVVSRVVKGLHDLDAIEELFDDMKAGKQFGKLVIQVATPETSSSKL
jgi:D-arabinose 1-dehydrogenase-like Zn-dependent alcohol dehydrogenase